jgi:prophage DNA circulation protein
VSDSSTSVRVEGVEAQLERVFTTLDKLVDRVTDMRVEVERMSGGLRNVQALVDGMHTRAEAIEREAKALAERIDALETAAAESRGEKRRGAIMAGSTAAAGGGMIAVLIELARRLLQ